MLPIPTVFLLGVLTLPTAAAAVSSGAPPETGLAVRRQALRIMLAEQWDYVLATHPEFASMLGDRRWNDRASEVSAAAVERDRAKTKEFLARFKALGTTGFPEQEALDQRLMVRDLEEAVALQRFDNHLMPVTQRSGIQLTAPRLATLLSFETVQDYDDYLSRLRALPARLDGTIALMRQGMARGLMPPKFLLEKVAQQARDLAATPAAESPFAKPLSALPASLAEAERNRIRAALLATLSTEVLPAFGRFATFVAGEYAPHGRLEVGMWSLPDGEARYAARVRSATTTGLTPAAIYQLGLVEVGRIEAEMLVLARRLGHADLKSFRASLQTNPDVRVKSPEQLVELYRKFTERMLARLPELFGRLPKAKLVVEPMPAFRAATAAGADYDPGAADGSRPGRINVNTDQATTRKTISVESTAYHEGVPGHHLQVSIALELPELPAFRQQAEYTAYNEGWALYAEDLGRDAGFFEDPYSLYGHLEDELMRAIRLVVDTGLHHRRWTREQVVDYFHQHSALDEVDVQSETDRYIAWPGQALGYKIGQLKLLELRARARRIQGARFDLRAFHDQVLGAGALPLDILEARIDAWLANDAMPAGPALTVPAPPGPARRSGAGSPRGWHRAAPARPPSRRRAA